MTWSEDEGFIGLGLPEDIRSVTSYFPPEEVDDESSNSNASAGSFSIIWGVILLAFMRARFRRLL